MSESLKKYYQTVCNDNNKVKEALYSIKGARCLITGANGVIGYALSRLLDEFTDVKLAVATRTSNFEGRAYLSTDLKIINYETIDSERYDFIFHCATHSQPTMFLKEWRNTVLLNSELLIRLLDRTNVRLVYMSSTEIYSGLRQDGREGESGPSTPQHPRGIYIESKRLAEAICSNSGIAHSLRIGPTAGPNASRADTRLIFELIRRGYTERQLSLQGGNKNIRQFQYSGACALRILVGGVLGKSELYNCAGPYVLTIEGLAKAIAEVLNIPYLTSEVDSRIKGASDYVCVSMERFSSEFPELRNIDPTVDNWLRWLVTDYIETLNSE